MKNLFIIFTAICLLTSCANYYRVALGSTPVTAQKIEDLKSVGKYFILRDGSNTYVMSNISFSTDQKILNCTLDSFPRFEHRLHLTKGVTGNFKYQDKKLSDDDETSVLNEVHIYFYSDGKSKTGTYSLQLDRIQKMEVLERDVAKTKKSKALGLGLGITGGVVLAAGLVALILASSSPFGIY